MLPLKNTPTVCLTQTNLIALMSTAVVITAAATFWCTRRLRTCTKAAIKPTLTVTAESPVTTPVPVKSTTNPVEDNSSYLCTSCGTEKYSADQLAAVHPPKPSPYKMVILVRTDLNMVIQHSTIYKFIIFLLLLFRVKVRLLLNAVTPF